MPNKSQSVLLAGAAVGVAAVIATFIPTLGGCLACILFIAAGVIAVWHYTDRHQLTLKGGQGLVLGGLAGLSGGIVQQVLSVLFSAIGLRPSQEEQMRQGLEQSNMDPAQVEQFMAMFSSPAAVVGLIVVGLLMSSIAGGIGGAIGASVFKRETNFFEEGPDTEGEDR